MVKQTALLAALSQLAGQELAHVRAQKQRTRAARLARKTPFH
jgi:hypothetical protein